jgi:hypothetical protein
MKSQKAKALRRVLALAVLLVGILLGTPRPAMACAGGGGFAECKSYWLDQFYVCLELNCSGIPPGPDYDACRHARWQEYRDDSASDCSNCPSRPQ